MAVIIPQGIVADLKELKIPEKKQRLPEGQYTITSINMFSPNTLLSHAVNKEELEDKNDFDKDQKESSEEQSESETAEDQGNVIEKIKEMEKNFIPVQNSSSTQSNNKLIFTGICFAGVCSVIVFCFLHYRLSIRAFLTKITL